MVFPVAVLLMAGLLLYSGLNDISVTDSIRTLLGRAPSGKLGSLSGFSAGAGGGSASPGAGGGSGSAIAAAAQSGVGIKSGYAPVRPYPKSLAACHQTPTDCSGFAILCCKEAGAPDPSGNNYNGSGYTGDMITHGQRIQLGQQQAGDLVFWNGPGHVAVCVGGNNIIGWGSAPGPSPGTISDEDRYHSSFAGIRRYT